MFWLGVICGAVGLPLLVFGFACWVVWSANIVVPALEPGTEDQGY